MQPTLHMSTAVVYCNEKTAQTKIVSIQEEAMLQDALQISWETNKLDPILHY